MTYARSDRLSKTNQYTGLREQTRTRNWIFKLNVDYEKLEILITLLILCNEELMTLTF